ncbi:MAG TPA: hypothetical protein VF765_26850 [Polyangiaceae bacterium]
MGTATAVEREHQIGLEVGAPMLVLHQNKNTVASGISGGLHYTYGLSDAFNLVADADSGVLFLGVPKPATLTHGDVGLAYVLDVLRWVPWASAEVGGYGLTGASVGGGTFLPGAAVAVGLDYRFDRSWAAGIVVREHIFFTNINQFPSLTEGFLRVGYTWGW